MCRILRIRWTLGRILRLPHFELPIIRLLVQNRSLTSTSDLTRNRTKYLNFQTHLLMSVALPRNRDGLGTVTQRGIAFRSQGQNRASQ